MITEEKIEQIAKLAMLKVEKNDIEKFQAQFNEILDYMKEMDNLDLSNEDAAFHINELQNIFREDEIKESLSNEEALSNAPDGFDGFFKVPKVI